jgi:tripartite-type tricarboxylate transporter receptor subunit TctC
MKFTTLIFAAAAALLASLANPVFAQAAKPFPSKPIRVVVPFGAGGIADLTVRAVSMRLSETLGQSVVVENRPGAGGIVAAETVARAEPDGHTLLLMSNGNAVSANLFKTLPFDPVKDFAPISTLGTFDLAVVVAADSPYQTMAQWLAAVRAAPGKQNLGSINVGSTQHLSAEWLKLAARLDLAVIPYNGTPAVVTALRGKQVDAAVEILGPTLAQVKSGALRVLATTGARRSAALPDVPTMQELGIKDFVATSWNALAAPAKTPADVIARLNKEIASALANPEVMKRLRELNVEPHASSPAQASDLLTTEIRHWGDIITRAKIAKQ